MEPEVLLDMYRKTYDAFLEAYKDLIDRNKKLTEFAESLVKSPHITDTVKEKLTQELEKIREL